MLEVDKFTYGHKNIQIMSWGEGAKVRIGKFCSISQNVRVFVGGNHNSNWVSTYPFGHINEEIFGDEKVAGHPSTNGDVIIGSDVWIGWGTTIMSGVTIGSGAILAANSHVVSDIPSYEIWGGNPARSIRRRFEPSLIDKLLELKWWDYPVEKISEISVLLNSNLTLDSLNEIKRALSS